MPLTPAELETFLEGSEDERLAAVRRIQREPSGGFLDVLRAALARERVGWVRLALSDAITLCDQDAGPSWKSLGATGAYESDDALQAYSDGRRDGLRQALHELAPLLGLARARGKRELDPGNSVAIQLDRMHAVSDALRRLVSASAAARRVEFDLGTHLRRIVVSLTDETERDVVGVVGPRPYIVRTDPDLLGLALSPLLSNAMESALAVTPTPSPRSVTVSWGAEASSHWIAVNDHGPGFPPEADLLPIGASTKPGHLGFGLQTSRTAIESLGGRIELENPVGGGARSLLVWPK